LARFARDSVRRLAQSPECRERLFLAGGLASALPAI